MAVIETMRLQRERQGAYDLLYQQKNTTVPVGAGNESNVVKLVLANKVNIQFTNGELFESLSTEADVLADTAHWESVATSVESTFSYSAGRAYLKVVNDGVAESIFNVTGV